ncbi:RHS repeat-associated core domain-containing protein [Plantactinospora mayteni]|uniref:Type IV secretion protein Rhs n=1 Tax=Plantactinospora mayteni TaxID=566021 RepID=A0ABQ4EXS3_9ACTN|nr:RHS repeat-associated core domain-containing protein [Plantactinospora mayteni]GIG99460.1 type IV secretion protein Rhs [Plantactinospora mayteni]
MASIRVMVAALVAAVAAPLVVPAGSVASAARPPADERSGAAARPAVERMGSVPVTAVPVRSAGTDPATLADSREPVPVRWPAAGAAEVSRPTPPSGRSAEREPRRAQAGDLPVRVGTPASGTAPERVRVEVLDQAAARAIGLTGVLLRLRRADGVTAAGRATVEVDYSGFAAAAGGSFGSRLRLLRLPDCAAPADPAPGTTGCAGAAVPVPGRNEVAARRLVAEVELPGTSDAVYAVAAAPEGSTGSFAATKLAPSATWQVGLQSGDFSWNYPLQAPKVPGPTPELAITYSASSVDGRAGSSNNQPSWVGEGFDLSTGYIERSYRTCKDDTGGSVNATDLCWVSDNATAALPGVGGALVRDDATGGWRAQNDSGWKVEKLTGANNGDDDGEHWRLTSPDGTQYYFGLNRPTGWASGRPETNSTQTVPVFGNHPGEPCRTSSAATSWCQQAYRWNLDYVVDRNGDAISYWYQRETNNYGRYNGSPYFGETTPYVRAAHLSRIDYGQRDGTVYSTTPGARVNLTAADRCRTAGSTCTSASGNWSNWPDVPWDQQCQSSCTYYWTPTFWTSKRLGSVSTQARIDGTLRDVDSWTLRQSYPDPYPADEPWGEENDASRSLWLNGITRTGSSGGTTALPEVTFTGVSMKNRHNGNADFPSLYKWRVARINTETGGQIQISYSAAQCGAEPYIVPDQNVSRCYPNGRLPSPYAGPDVFYKYVVSQVAEVDLVGGAPTRLTQYEYVGGAAWHYDDSEATPTNRRDWNHWRGYQKVRVRTGNASAGVQGLTEHLFLRGMDDDRLSGGGRRDVRVTDSTGAQVEDHPRLSGFTRETTVHDGVGGPMVTSTINDPYLTAPLATRARTGNDPLQAYQLDIAVIRKRAALAGGGTRLAEEHRSFDAQGRIRQVNDLGDVADSTDDRCTQTTYATSPDRHLTNLPSRLLKLSRSCDSIPRYPADLISDERLYYDGAATTGTIPAAGHATRHDKTASWGASGQAFVTNVRASYDSHGRAVETLDSGGNRSTTTFTPASGGPVTQLVRTNPLGHTETTVLDPARAQPVAQVDAAGRRTDASYDALGRLTCVWEPGRPRTSCATATRRYAYQVSTGGPSVVSTATLRGDGGYTTSYLLLDGLLRERQTQDPSPSGGRIVTDVLYDSQGRVARKNAPYYHSSPPAGTLASAADEAVPAATTYGYDGASRPTVEALRSYGVEQWRSTTTYAGDRVSVDPPDGETATTRILDVEGKMVELRQYSGGAPTGAYDATRYTYTRAGQLSSVTDPAGNVWRYGYDLRGRKTSTEDPDAGTTNYVYDEDDRLVSTTDGRGQTVAYDYDDAGRKIGAYAGSLDGSRLASWSYDTAPGGVGLPATSTRYLDGHAYTTEVLGYDQAGRPTGTAVTIPAVENGLAGRYQNRLTYNDAGQVGTVRMPFVEGRTTLGGLPDETLTLGYTPLGLSSTLTGLAGYVTGSRYTELSEPLEQTFGAAGAQVWQTFGYDPATRRVVRAQVTRESASQPSVADRRYDYDPAGNLRSVTDTPAGGAADTQCFRYDHLRRLVTAWTPTGGCAAAPSTSALGGPAPYWHDYSYDAAGNRLSEVRHAAGGDSAASYGYPAAGTAQPHTVRTVTRTGPGGPGTDSYSYDAAGNTTARPGQALTWDAEGHLATVTAGSAVTSFVYDADGNRLLRRDPGGTTLYLDGMELRADSGTGAVTGTRSYRFGGETVAVRTPAGLTWVATDLHGTADLAIDAASLAVTVRRHLPFGAPRGATPTWPDERGFVGGQRDASTGLTHLGAREYDPAIGRFISADPVTDVEDPQQLQGYAYAENNPTSFSDPDGRKTKKEQQKQLQAELKKLMKQAFRDPDALYDILTKLVDLLKKDPYSKEVRTELNKIASIINAEVDDIYKELGASSLSSQAKKGLQARIQTLANFITSLGELVQTVLGKEFATWRARQNAGVTLAARGEAAAAGASCSQVNGGLWVCGGAKWTFKDREYTHGNIFLTKRPTKDALKDKLLLAHEVRHATQWALFGPIWFAALYDKMDKLSKRAFQVFGPRKLGGQQCTDPGACYNPFEMDANLFGGGYYK